MNGDRRLDHCKILTQRPPEMEVVHQFSEHTNKIFLKYARVSKMLVKFLKQMALHINVDKELYQDKI